jgi:hypothetical protein
MIWLGIASIGLAMVTILGGLPLPKVLITLEFFVGVWLILWGYDRRQKKRNGQQQPN